MPYSSRNLIILMVPFLLLSCRENQPEYTLARPEPGERIVVVEEFSGVRCPNCPEGTKELENLRALYNDQVIIITIHAGDFAFEYPESVYDFTTPEGNALLDLLGNPIGYPSAVINRVAGSNGILQAFSSRWGSLISDAIDQDPIVSLTLDVDYDLNTRNLEAVIGVVPNRNIDGDLQLTVLLKEDQLVDWQSDSEVEGGVDKSYHHRNVLRKVITAPYGDLIAQNAVEFERTEKTYKYTLPEHTTWWNAQNLMLVAFVTDVSGEILQGIEKPLRP
ncbi:MAG: Omp28-related outer membrane protein [Saprospiraceae bacterium]|nr:Omp28-related outer membrane protein [Saprospiraceae bacterium]